MNQDVGLDPPGSPSSPNLSGGGPPSQREPQTPPDQTATPTHHTHDVKLRTDAVQLLVSTESHLYDTRRVELEDSAWQCKGTMNDASIQGLIEAVKNRRTGSQSHTSDKPEPAPRSFQGFERPLGTGGRHANS
ncbi:hypothetical protein FSOLCH5_009816 [Fusarium solani]|jgi:hypothetical protein